MGTSTALPLARQSVVDAEGRRIGYELLFRGPRGALPGGEGWDLAAQDRATSSVISTAFGDVAPESLADGGLLFINLTRSFLVGDVPLPMSPEGVVLEVLEDIPVDALLVDGLRRLREDGYVLALDDFAGEADRLELLPLVDVVKIDLERVRAHGRDLTEVASTCRAANPHARLLAERVETVVDVEEGVAAGCTWFQGYWFDRPRVVGGMSLSPSQTVCARVVALLADADATPWQVEALVREDPALALRVLRWVGSAASGTRGTVTSMGHALVLLGSRALMSWVVLAMLGATERGRLDDLVLVLTRARTCELLASEGGCAGPLYTIGLLSGMSDVMGVPVDELVRDTGVGDLVADALVHGSGPAGRILRAVRALDGHGEWGDGDGEPAPAAVASAHVRALGSAARSVRSVQDLVEAS